MDQNAKLSLGPQANPRTSAEAENESEEPPSTKAAPRRRIRAASAGRDTSQPSIEPTRTTNRRRTPRPPSGAPSRRSTRAPLQTLEDVRTATWRVPDVSDVEVVVLYSLALGMERGRNEDRIADQETAAVASGIASALEGHVRRTHRVPVWDDLPMVLRQFDPRRHVIFNLVESLGGRAFTEPEAARVLESMGFIHTGTDFRSLTRASNKLTTKKLLETSGLPTPRYQVVRTPTQRRFTVPLPAIVKPVAEGGSFGVTLDSLARDEHELSERVRACLEIYRQPALAEEYVAGREINVALWGNARPTVLPISEILFNWTSDPLKQFVTFDSKWLVDSVEYVGTPGVCPASLTPEEQARVEAAAILAYQALGFRGFARVDMRLRDGQPYILEVNANPDLAADAGFFRSAAAAGFTYHEMVLNILRLALDAHNV
jgi:D-alanine-D-alanine ligase